MIPKATIISEDFRTVRGQRITSGGDYGIRKFFEPDYMGDLPNITTISCESADKLTAFIVSQFLPTNGDWIDFGLMENDDVIAAQKLRQIFCDYVRNSNFYPEMTRCVRSGLLYSRGLINCLYSSCLSFKAIDHQNIYLSNDTDLANRRVYTECTYSGADLRGLFANLPEYLTPPVNEAEDHAATSYFTVVEGILPLNSRFFPKESSHKYYNYKKVYLLLSNISEEVMLEPIDGKDVLYKSLPIVSYDLGRSVSLGQLALSHSVRYEQYEQQFSDYSDKVVRPPLTIGQNVYRRNTHNIVSGGMTVLGENEREPKPIVTTQNLPFGLEDKREIERSIQRIFMWDMIERTKITNLSQFELNSNRLAALEEILPLVDDFFARSLNYLVDRVHNLLKDTDKDYKKLTNSLRGKLMVRGAGVVVERLQKRVDMARFAQAIVPFIDMNRNAGMRVNSDQAIIHLAELFKVTNTLTTDEELAQEQEEMIKMQQQQQQAEQGNLNADTEQKLAQAEE